MGFSKGSSEIFFNVSYGTVQGGAKLVRQAKPYRVMQNKWDTQNENSQIMNYRMKSFFFKNVGLYFS